MCVCAYTYINIYIYVTIISEKQGHEFEREQGGIGYREGLEEERNREMP